MLLTFQMDLQKCCHDFTPHTGVLRIFRVCTFCYCCLGLFSAFPVIMFWLSAFTGSTLNYIVFNFAMSILTFKFYLVLDLMLKKFANYILKSKKIIFSHFFEPLRYVQYICHAKTIISIISANLYDIHVRHRYRLHKNYFFMFSQHVGPVLIT